MIILRELSGEFFFCIPSSTSFSTLCYRHCHLSPKAHKLSDPMRAFLEFGWLARQLKPPKGEETCFEQQEFCCLQLAGVLMDVP